MFHSSDLLYYYTIYYYHWADLCRWIISPHGYHSPSSQCFLSPPSGINDISWFWSSCYIFCLFYFQIIWLSNLFIMRVHYEGYSRNMTLSVHYEGYSRNMTLSVHYEGYSRNASCALTKISTFLWHRSEKKQGLKLVEIRSWPSKHEIHIYVWF